MSVELPTTRYARSGDVSLAYQVFGDSEIDVVLVPGTLSHLELGWEDPAYARFYKRLASFARMIVFDKRGMGLSERVDLATPEERMDDIRAVMDAAGSERAAMFGISEGGAIAGLFAAAMSSMDSGINSLTATVVCDWMKGRETSLAFSRMLTVAFGMLAIAAAVLIAQPPGRLQTAGFAFAAFLWTVVVLILIGIAALLIASAAHPVQPI